MKAARLALLILICAALALTALIAGCSGGPSAANIVLRKENQQLTTQVASLQIQNAGLTAQIAALQSTPGSTVLDLPQSRLDKLYTVHGFKFGRLTGGFPGDPVTPDQMVKVYVVPTDDDGQDLKAAGSFVVELFDLNAPDTRLGRWEFSVNQARARWFGATLLGESLLYCYALDCPWQKPPRHASLLLKVTFTDELTHRQFQQQRQITVNPPTTQAAD